LIPCFGIQTPPPYIDTLSIKGIQIETYGHSSTTLLWDCGVAVASPEARRQYHFMTLRRDLDRWSCRQGSSVVNVWE
jgi:hypothetical protein